MKRVARIPRANAIVGILLPRRPFTCSAVMARSTKGMIKKRRSPASPVDVVTSASRKAAQPSNTYYYFRLMVEKCLEEVLEPFKFWDPARFPEQRAYGFNSPAEMRTATVAFSESVERSLTMAMLDRTSKGENPLFWSLRYGFVRGSTPGLLRELRYALRMFVARDKFYGNLPDSALDLIDMRYPAEWYPDTRAMERTIHLHVGPTNSGKTYNALKALENARTGIYAGPLRLLAHEIYSRLRAKGKDCALVTGEEQRFPDVDAFLMSCTVEMTPLNTRVDVAVIDEIQMAASPDRGWAWTQALLGVQAREVHLCGEDRSVDIVRALCHSIGDKCVVHRYERLSPLQTMRDTFNSDFKSLRKGDAVVAFSRVGLHSIKAEIEKKTGRRCAVVYGSLPPETRAEQAALFNDPDNDYDFLAASDAVGMGLNLAIKRVIFDSTAKFDGQQNRFLTVPEIKQIGGRAGRFRSAAQDIQQASSASVSDGQSGNASDTGAGPSLLQQTGSVGWVGGMSTDDLARIQQAFETEAPPIQSVGIQPPTFVVERLMSYFPPGTPLSVVLLTIRERCQLSDEFFMTDLDENIFVADLIHPFTMSIADRCVFLTAPHDRRGSTELLKKLARCVSEGKGGHLLDIEDIELELLDAQPPEGHQRDRGMFLKKIEKLHLDITLYLWLSYRFMGVFTSQTLAFHVKALVEEKIKGILESIDYRADRRKRQEAIVKALLEREEASRMVIGDEAPEETGWKRDATADDPELEEIGEEESSREGAGESTATGSGVVIDSSALSDTAPSSDRAESATDSG